MNPGETNPRPTQLRVSKDRRTLTAVFADGAVFDLPAEMLRVLSPSAEVQGHSPDQRQLVHGKAEVGIANVVPTGNYAIRIVFDDRHDTGIFTWPFLRDLGERLDEKVAAYERELAAQSRSRMPSRS